MTEYEDGIAAAKAEFVFLDSASRAYSVQMLSGVPWLCYWNKAFRCFSTLRKITDNEIMQYQQHALPDDEASIYFSACDSEVK